ncbi:unnamed protein product [Moneuplotes crassus]|uniref:Uncharacterized protein n=1 Tax=Euplotes crassus TaxID=5936 RepID=A0AAD1XC22_EUPCR|nr:unnamed protein product [Moneuplotes crassus]
MLIVLSSLWRACEGLEMAMLSSSLLLLSLIDLVRILIALWSNFLISLWIVEILVIPGLLCLFHLHKILRILQRIFLWECNLPNNLPFRDGQSFRLFTHQ